MTNTRKSRTAGTASLPSGCLTTVRSFLSTAGWREEPGCFCTVSLVSARLTTSAPIPRPSSAALPTTPVQQRELHYSRRLTGFRNLEEHYRNRRRYSRCILQHGNQTTT